MNHRRLFYKDINGKVNDLLEYVEELEKERDEALEKVQLWNESDEVKKAKDNERAAYAQLADGFAPDKEQWEKIKAWQKQHSEKYHQPPKDYRSTGSRKKMPTWMPYYRYSFEYTQLGTLGSVQCVNCYQKALAKSLGNIELLRNKCEKNDVEFFFGEV